LCSQLLRCLGHLYIPAYYVRIFSGLLLRAYCGLFVSRGLRLRPLSFRRVLIPCPAYPPLSGRWLLWYMAPWTAGNRL